MAKKTTQNQKCNSTNSTMTDAERQLVVKTIMNGTPFILGGKRLAEIDPNCISIDYNYQRAPRMNRVKRIAENWDARKAGVITCSYRDNEFWAIDGQNRTLAARLANVPAVVIEILTGLTAEEDAMLFANQDENKSNVSNLAKYKANLFAGTDYAVKLYNKLAAYGLTLTSKKGRAEDAYCINCTAALQSLVLNPAYGFDCLDWILSTFKSATWLGAKNAMVTKHINHMASVWHEGVTDDVLNKYTENLIAFLTAVSPDRFQALASHAFPHLPDHRSSNRSMFYSVARGDITLNNPIVSEASFVCAEDE